jgi:hypothetical protein
MITPMQKGKMPFAASIATTDDPRNVDRSGTLITGTYDFPLKSGVWTRAFCLTSAAMMKQDHEGGSRREGGGFRQYDGDSVQYNPARSCHGKQDCNRCHSVHGSRF